MYNVCKFVLVLYNLEIAVAKLHVHNHIGSVMVTHLECGRWVGAQVRSNHRKCLLLFC